MLGYPSMRKLLITLFLLILFGLVALLATVGFTLHRYSQTFFEAAQVDPKAFLQMVREGWYGPVDAPNGVVSFLVLGLDEVEGRNEPVLTDSMMLVTLRVGTGEVTMVSIPRDLWIDQYKTKINALYFYGLTRPGYEGTPQRFPKEVVEDITGVPIQYVLVLTLKDVGEFIDTLGGVDVDVQRTFTDDLFPRPGVDVATVRDPKILYESATFTEGVEHMNGERALIFMRSRHSTDLIEGTDDARARRQQQVISAVVTRMKQTIATLDFETMGRTYAFYNRTYASVIDFRQVIALFRTFITMPVISLNPIDITPLLMNPPESKHKQWVYEPKDSTWNALRQVLQATASATISR